MTKADGPRVRVEGVGAATGSALAPRPAAPPARPWSPPDAVQLAFAWVLPAGSRVAAHPTGAVHAALAVVAHAPDPSTRRRATLTLAAELAALAHRRGRAPAPKPSPPPQPSPSRDRLPLSAQATTLATFAEAVVLTSVDPARNRARFYRLTWQPTLWGEVALVRTWGRLGSPGRTRVVVCADRAAGQAAAAGLLRQRLRHGYVVQGWA